VGCLLSAVVCLAFLPVSRLASVLVLLAMIGVIVAFWYIARPRAEHDVNLRLDDLPETTYRQPVVLVCGDAADLAAAVTSTDRHAGMLDPR
jgi:hypothetical protein